MEVGTVFYLSVCEDCVDFVELFFCKVHAVEIHSLERLVYSCDEVFSAAVCRTVLCLRSCAKVREILPGA